MNYNIENTKFGKNIYFKEIVLEFLNSYNQNQVQPNIQEELISIRTNDMAGARDITFAIKNNQLEIIINRMIDMVRYQDILLYDAVGIMMKRSNCIAFLKPSANLFVNDDPSILASEFSLLGQKNSIYSSKIFKSINFTEVERPSNYGLIGKYINKQESYNDKGLREGKLIEGEFPVLETNSISSLEFPSIEKVKVTSETDLTDLQEYTYPNNRML